MKLLITGAAGRLGAVTMRTMINARHRVTGTDLQYRRDPITGQSLQVADLCQRTDVYPLLENIEAIVHLAAHPLVASQRDPLGSFNANQQMTANVFQAAADRGIQRMIFASTSQVISGQRQTGDQDQPSCLTRLPIDGQAPAQPGSLYALAKANAEQMLKMLCCKHQMIGVCLRLPVLLDAATATHLIEQPPEQPWPGLSLDEGFAWLGYQDAANCLLQTLRIKKPGYYCYHPANAANYLGKSPAQLIQTYYPNVPINGDPATLTSLIDQTPLVNDLKFKPTGQ